MHAYLETSFPELKLLTQRVCTLLTLRDAARMVLAGMSGTVLQKMCDSCFIQPM